MTYGLADGLFRSVYAERYVGAYWRQGWNNYWLAWTLLAGWHGLSWLSARGARRAGSGSGHGRTAAGRWEVGGTVAVWAGLGLSLGLFLWSFGGDRGTSGQTASLSLLLLPSLAPLFQWFRVLLCRPCPELARGRTRRFLTGLAGWILLWGVFAAFAGYREKAWVARDRFLVPDLGDGGFIGPSACENRLVEPGRRHLAEVLAEEDTGAVPER